MEELLKTIKNIEAVITHLESAKKLNSFGNLALHSEPLLHGMKEEFHTIINDRIAMLTMEHKKLLKKKSILENLLEDL